MSGRRERRGQHEPVILVIRRPRARVPLTRTDAELLMRALADAAGFRERRAARPCAVCDAEPDGVCEEHLEDGALTGAYRALAERLADVLPGPPRRRCVMTGEPVIEVLRSAADALAADLPVWEARDPAAPSPEARRARRSAIATADAVIITLSGLRARLGGDRR